MRLPIGPALPGGNVCVERVPFLEIPAWPCTPAMSLAATIECDGWITTAVLAPCLNTSQ
jgi:hypothetical protein